MNARINVKRALGCFFLAWLGMDVLGTLSYVLLSLLMTGSLRGMAATGALNVAADPVWRVSNVFLPVINLPVWMSGAWLYMKRPRTDDLLAEAWRLGFFWLVIVLPLDFLHYVAIPTPLTIDARAFYIDQAPWIYIVYAIVLMAPWALGRVFRYPVPARL